jgi:aldehyde:ferredoxin oxidoreductase
MASYSGKFLHVDLTEQKTWIEEISDYLYRKFLGGSALAAHFLLREIKPGIDPLSPENVLVITTSVINGLPLSGANRYNVAAKSPLTGGYGEGQAGGYWGPEFKKTGFDGMIIHGRAEKPIYLFVHDELCEFCDAGDYWGKLSGEVQDGLEDELGDKNICVLQTGVAGENQVLYASLVNQLCHYHGRTGLGAVFGSKNLKAIVTRGKKSLKAADEAGAKDILTWYRENYNKEDDLLHIHGTAGFIPYLDDDGILPTHNFREGSFEESDSISGQTMTDTILANRATCYACRVICKKQVKVPERGVVPKYGGMEYETIAAVGSICGVGDMASVAEASQWLNRYVLDSISTGVSIAFAMECYENGIITSKDTDGVELTWGNGDAMIEMIHKIAKREGIGELLAGGVKRAAEQLGNGAEQFAMHVKGQELAIHEPRGKKGVALQYAISPTGADHVESPHDPDFEAFGEQPHKLRELGLIEPVDRMDLGYKKVYVFTKTQMIWALYNCIGMCDFVGVPFGALPLSKLRDFVNAATGWDMSLFEMMKVGERAKTMARLFNLREGFTKADDTLPPRMFTPLQNGKYEGSSIGQEEFNSALELYYQAVGWDENGVPTKGKIAELGLSWILEGTEAKP